MALIKNKQKRNDGNYVKEICLGGAVSLSKSGFAQKTTEQTRLVYSRYASNGNEENWRSCRKDESTEIFAI